MTFSIPLFGESRPNVNKTSFPFGSKAILVEIWIRKRQVGNAVRNQIIFDTGT